MPYTWITLDYMEYIHYGFLVEHEKKHISECDKTASKILVDIDKFYEQCITNVERYGWFIFHACKHGSDELVERIINEKFKRSTYDLNRDIVKGCVSSGKHQNWKAAIEKYLACKNRTYFELLVTLCLCDNEDAILDVLTKFWNVEMVKGAKPYRLEFLHLAIQNDYHRLVKFFIENIPKEMINYPVYFYTAVIHNKLYIADTMLNKCEKQFGGPKTKHLMYASRYIEDISWTNVFGKFTVESFEYLMDLYRSERVKLTDDTVVHLITSSIIAHTVMIFEMACHYFPHVVESLHTYKYCDIHHGNGKQESVKALLKNPYYVCYKDRIKEIKTEQKVDV